MEYGSVIDGATRRQLAELRKSLYFAVVRRLLSSTMSSS